MIHVVGLDVSLTGFGVARLRIPEDHAEHGGEIEHRLTRHGRPGSSTETLVERRERLRVLASQVASDALHGYDQTTDGVPVVLIESPTYSTSVTGSQHDRSGLWWLIVHILMKRAIVVEVGISALKQYATGRGRFRKEEGKTPVVVAVNEFLPDYFPTITDDNIADAIVLAAMAARQLGSPIEVSVQRCHPGALSSVRWPDTINQRRNPS